MVYTVEGILRDFNSIWTNIPMEFCLKFTFYTNNSQQCWRNQPQSQQETLSFRSLRYPKDFRRLMINLNNPQTILNAIPTPEANIETTQTTTIINKRGKGKRIKGTQ